MIIILTLMGLIVVPFVYKEYREYVKINGDNPIYHHATAAFMALGIFSSFLMVYSYFVYPEIVKNSWIFMEF
jgi:hypothetical protein